MNTKKNILIVDDHAMMRSFLSFYLSKKFDVQLAVDGIDALEWLENNEAPSFIVVDLDMPRMNGYDFLNTIKGNPKYDATAVVVLSSASLSENRIKAYELGADDMIQKPFNPRELQIKLEQWNREMKLA